MTSQTPKDCVIAITAPNISIGFMFGTGGSALIAKTMGEGKAERANEIFSLLICTSAACGVVLAVLGIAFLPGAASLMGAEGRLLADCVERFVRTLPDTQRRVFLRRYWYLDSAEQMAKRFAMSKTQVTTTLHRLRVKLRAYLEQEGFEL